MSATAPQALEEEGRFRPARWWRGSDHGIPYADGVGWARKGSSKGWRIVARARAAGAAHRLWWATGWERDARCPPSLRRLVGKAGPFEISPARRAFYSAARAAGYVARHWPRHVRGQRICGRSVVDDVRYTSGPAAGCAAVDPWRLARAVRGCGRAFYLVPRVCRDGTVVTSTEPVRCGQRHACADCAAYRSNLMARCLRDVIGSWGPVGEWPYRLVLVTLTQRDIVGETLSSALARLRGAWRALRVGRAGAEWKARFPSYFYGIEVTSAWLREGLRWHPHIHVIVAAPKGANPGALRRWLADRWAALTDAQRAGDGWQPAAGNYDRARDAWIGVAAEDPSRRWWRDVGESLAEVKQAAKYPCPVADLTPRALAEWLAVAYGQRWHDGGGMFRGVRRRAEELEEERAGIEDTGAEDDDRDRPDLGRMVCSLAPGACPTDEDIAEAAGLVESVDPETGTVDLVDEGGNGSLPLRWELARRFERDADVRAALVAAGMELRDEYQSRDDRYVVALYATRGWARARFRPPPVRSPRQSDRKSTTKFTKRLGCPNIIRRL